MRQGGDQKIFYSWNTRAVIMFSTICIDLQLNKSLTSLWRFKKFPISSGIAPAVQPRDNVHQDSILARTKERKKLAEDLVCLIQLGYIRKKLSNHTLVHFELFKKKLQCSQSTLHLLLPLINFSLSITHVKMQTENKKKFHMSNILLILYETVFFPLSLFLRFTWMSPAIPIKGV